MPTDFEDLYQFKRRAGSGVAAAWRGCAASRARRTRADPFPHNNVLPRAWEACSPPAFAVWLLSWSVWRGEGGGRCLHTHLVSCSPNKCHTGRAGTQHRALKSPPAASRHPSLVLSPTQSTPPGLQTHLRGESSSSCFCLPGPLTISVVSKSFP